MANMQHGTVNGTENTLKITEMASKEHKSG